MDEIDRFLSKIMRGEDTNSDDIDFHLYNSLVDNSTGKNDIQIITDLLNKTTVNKDKESNIILKTNTVNISGRIGDLLNHIPSKMRKENLLDEMINRPIMNGEKVVGVITDCNIETGFWNGVLWCDTYPSIMESHICSVELK